MQVHFSTLAHELDLGELKLEIPEVHIEPPKKEEIALKKPPAPLPPPQLLDSLRISWEQIGELEEKTNDDVFDFELDTSSDEEEIEVASQRTVVREPARRAKSSPGRRKLSVRASAAAKRLMSSISRATHSTKNKKWIDAFSIPTDKNKSAGWYQKVLDTHDLVAHLRNEIEKVKDEESEMEKDSEVLPLLHPDQLIEPGTKLKGSIHIPGRSNASSYKLHVVRSCVSELGDRFYVARHIKPGDGDKQAVTIVLGNTRDDLREIQYEDLDTTCNGWISKESVSGRVVETKADGEVHQLMDRQEGFYKERREENTFHLMRTSGSKSKKILLLDKQLEQAKAARAMSLAVWSLITPSGTVCSEQFYGRHLDWGEVLEDMRWLVEEVNANLRRQASLVKGLTFKNLSDRKKKLDGLSRKGISRAQAHKTWDAATLLMTSIRERTPAGCTIDQHRYDYLSAEVQHSLGRQETCYERFDHALRSASKRVFLQQLEKWEMELPEGSRKPEDGPCMICLQPLGGKVLDLPCGHMFHLHCGTGWFHLKSYCPVCTVDYGEDD